MNAAYVMLQAFRWGARVAVIAGIIALFAGGFMLAAFQGFSPDGPPPGFVPIPSVIFALLAAPYLLFVSLAEAPWIALPLFGFAVADLGWLILVPPATKAAVRARLRPRSGLVLAGLIVAVGTYTTAALHAHRTGPAELCVFNGSEFPCEDVVLVGEGFAHEFGRLMPGERAFATVSPRGRSGVWLRFMVDGEPRELAFTGGVEDSRRYYYQFTVGEGLRAEYNAWDVRRWGSAIRIRVLNERPDELRDIVVSGPGFSRRIDRLSSGGTEDFRVVPRGPSISVSYVTSDGAPHTQSWGGWGLLEGPPVLVRVGQAVDFGFD